MKTEAVAGAKIVPVIRKYWRLFAALSLAETARFCYLRFSFRILERAGLPERLNFVFIVQCAASPLKSAGRRFTWG